MFNRSMSKLVFHCLNGYHMSKIPEWRHQPPSFCRSVSFTHCTPDVCMCCVEASEACVDGTASTNSGSCHTIHPSAVPTYLTKATLSRTRYDASAPLKAAHVALTLSILTCLEMLLVQRVHFVIIETFNGSVTRSVFAKRLLLSFHLFQNNTVPEGRAKLQTYCTPLRMC